MRLVSALTVMSNQEPNSYYLKMQTEFASNAFAILHETLGAGRYTLLDLWRFVCEEDFQKALVEQASPGNSIAYRWFSQQWAKEDPRERMMLTKGFRADLTQFVSDEMRPTFCRAEATFPGWKCLTEEGKIVIFNMNPNRWGTLARALGVFLMMDFQDFMLARSTPAFKLAGGNNDRLVICLADEAWFYMNENWANFTSVSREARCCTIALHQGLAQIPEKYRPTMLGNHRTWVMLAVNDSLTTQTLSAELGTYQTVRASRSEASGYQGVERGLLVDDMTAKAGGESRSVSVSYADVELPRFTPDSVQSLKKWTAIVRVFDGDQLQPPRLVSLLPGHLNKLG
ncbi:type IV secretory system conjugative DNA transfer family protein [Cystobacter fuscus]